MIKEIHDLFFVSQMGDLILTFYAGLSVLGITVALRFWYLYFSDVRTRLAVGYFPDSESTRFKFGIALGWSGTACLRVWFWFWYFLKDTCVQGDEGCYSWMLESFFVMLFVSFLMKSGLIHMASTTKRMGHLGWIGTLLLMLTAMLSQWFYLQS